MIYLASASPRRSQLLKEAGVSFKVLKSDYAENNIPGTSPIQLVESHALGKALWAAARISEGRILAADTVVYFRKKIIGKPTHMSEAIKTLSLLQGQWHAVYTGVAYLDVQKRKVVSRKVFYEKTLVRLKRMTRPDIMEYFKRVHPLDKAGAYAIQEKKDNIVQQVRGSYTNAVGLPMERLGFL